MSLGKRSKELIKGQVWVLCLLEFYRFTRRHLCNSRQEIPVNKVELEPEYQCSPGDVPNEIRLGAASWESNGGADT